MYQFIKDRHKESEDGGMVVWAEGMGSAGLDSHNKIVLGADNLPGTA